MSDIHAISCRRLFVRFDEILCEMVKLSKILTRASFKLLNQNLLKCFLVLLYKTETLYTAHQMYNWMEYSSITLNEKKWHTEKVGAQSSCESQLQERQN